MQKVLHFPSDVDAKINEIRFAGKSPQIGRHQMVIWVVLDNLFGEGEYIIP